MTFDFRLIFLPIVSFLSILFGLFIFLHNRRNITNLFYSLAIFNIGFWSLGVFMFFTSDFSLARFWANLLYLTGSIIVASFFIFTLTFFDEHATIHFLPISLIFIPNIFFLYLLFFTDALVQHVFLNPATGDRVLEFGSLYPFYWIYFILVLVVSFLILFKKYRISIGIERIHIRSILFASMIAGVFNTVTNIILPTSGNFNYFWLGPYSTFVLVPILVVAIIRYKLFDVKIIMTELLIFSVWVFLSAKTLLAQSLQEQILDGGLLGLLIILGILLIRSVRQEVEQREKMELLAKDLRIANERLKELDDLKTDFISVTSHQLRTPLTAIKGYASMVLEGIYGEVPLKVRGTVEKIFESAQRLIYIVNDILDVSRIEQGRLQLAFEEIKVLNVLEGAVEELKSIAEKNGVALELVASIEDAEIKIKADASKMRQVFVNLIDNAIKYTPAGFVRVALARKEGIAMITVTDSGVGMSKDTMKRLFQKFSRARNASRIKADGSGLGLYIVREIVKAHGGEAWGESEGEGKGSQFFISLPLHTLKTEAIRQFADGI